MCCYDGLCRVARVGLPVRLHAGPAWGGPTAPPSLRLRQLALRLRGKSRRLYSEVGPVCPLSIIASAVTEAAPGARDPPATWARNARRLRTTYESSARSRRSSESNVKFRLANFAEKSSHQFAYRDAPPVGRQKMYEVSKMALLAHSPNGAAERALRILRADPAARWRADRVPSPLIAHPLCVWVVGGQSYNRAVNLFLGQRAIRASPGLARTSRKGAFNALSHRAFSAVAFLLHHGQDFSGHHLPHPPAHPVWLDPGDNLGLRLDLELPRRPAHRKSLAGCRPQVTMRVTIEHREEAGGVAGQRRDYFVDCAVAFSE